MAVIEKTIRLNSGGLMPRIGLGTWQSAPGEVGEAVRTAIAAGYRHIDCAFLYLNETEVGEALQDCIQGKLVTRDELFIISKLWSTCHAYDQVKPAVLDSMRMLGVNYLDLYLIHWPFALKAGGDHFPRDENGILQHIDVDFMETWKALECCVDEGLIKAIGVSNFNSKQIQTIIDNGRIKPAVLQVEVHPYLSQTKLVNYCQERDIVVTAYSPLGSNARPWAEPKTEPLFQNTKLLGIGKKYKKTPAQVILRWMLQRQLTAVPKSCNPGRIAENIDVFDFSLSEADMQAVNSINRDLRLVTYGNGHSGDFSILSLEKTDHQTRIALICLLNTTDIIPSAPYFPFNEEF